MVAARDYGPYGGRYGPPARATRDPVALRVGDALDFWRVEAVETNRLLRLRAEMKVPGSAWLQFEVEDLDEGDTGLAQTAFFAPKGLAGLLYWYLLYPIHSLIFSGMIRRLAQEAEAIEKGEPVPTPSTAERALPVIVGLAMAVVLVVLLFRRRDN